MTKSLMIIIGAKNDTDSAFGAVKENLMGLTSSIASSAAKLVGGALATIGVGLGLREIIEEATGSESAVSGLSAALTAAGQNAAANLPQLRAYASSIQDVTTYSDEAIMDLEKMAINLGKFSGDEIKAATTAAIGLAAKLGIDAPEAMTLIAKAANGNTEALAKHGLVIDANASAQQKLNQVLAIGTANFSQVQAQGNTTAGMYARLKNQISEIFETLGKPVTDMLRPILEVANGAARAINGVLGEVMDRVTAGLADCEPAIVEFLNFLGTTFVSAYEIGSNLLEIIGNAFRETFDYISEVFKSAGLPLSGWKETLVGTFAVAEFFIKHWKEVAALGLLEFCAAIVNAEDHLAHWGTLTKQIVGYAIDLFVNFAKDTSLVLNNLSDNIIRIFVSIPELISGKVKFAELWRPLTEGFVGEALKLPELAKFHSSALADALGKDIENLKSGLGESLGDFVAKRLKQSSGGLADYFSKLFHLPDFKSPSFDGKVRTGGDGTAGVIPGGGTSQQATNALETSRFLTGVKQGGNRGEEIAQKQLTVQERLLSQQQAHTQAIAALAAAIQSKQPVNLPSLLGGLG